jgi:hypothetical protein
VIGYLAILSVLVVTLAFVFSPRAGVLATLVLHPIAAAGWYANYFLGGIKMNPLVFIGILVPAFVLMRAFTRGPSLAQMPLIGIWGVYVLYNIFAGTLHALDEGPAQSLNLISRHVAGFAGFYMVQAFFTQKEHFKRLTIALILSGLFPVLVILYQIASGSGQFNNMYSGGDLRLDTAGDLTRYSGFYHDIVSARGYAFQCLSGIFLYWGYFIRPNRDVVVKILLGLFVLACLLVVYKMYSKAAIGTLVMWFLIWSIGTRRLGIGIVLALLVIGLNAIQSDKLFNEAGQVFEVQQYETIANSTDPHTNRLLAGRVGMWEGLLEKYSNATIFEKMFGSSTAFGVHNDYLQKLFYGGVVGLAIYVVLLWNIGNRVALLFLKNKSPINLMAAMVFSGWMIDTVGVVPSLYPGYQWYVWGLIGLAIKELEFEKESDETPSRQTPNHPIWLRDSPVIAEAPRKLPRRLR